MEFNLLLMKMEVEMRENLVMGITAAEKFL